MLINIKLDKIRRQKRKTWKLMKFCALWHNLGMRFVQTAVTTALIATLLSIFCYLDKKITQKQHCAPLLVIWFFVLLIELYFPLHLISVFVFDWILQRDVALIFGLVLVWEFYFSWKVVREKSKQNEHHWDCRRCA